jgi:hypothetical protein
VKRLRRFGLAITLVLAGFLIGPVLLVAWQSLSQTPEKWDDLFRNQELVKTYDIYNRPAEPIYHTMVIDQEVGECGYTYETLFDGRDEANPRIALSPKLNDRWTPYTGYSDLTGWKRETYDDLTSFARARVLNERISFSGAIFLNGCIDRTALAPVCAAYVRSILAPRHLDRAWIDPPSVDQSRENKTICAYFDGLAARAGRPLPARAQERPSAK